MKKNTKEVIDFRYPQSTCCFKGDWSIIVTRYVLLFLRKSQQNLLDQIIISNY
jgi:hypothetical protein